MAKATFNALCDGHLGLKCSLVPHSPPSLPLDTPTLSRDNVETAETTDAGRMFLLQHAARPQEPAELPLLCMRLLEPL